MKKYIYGSTKDIHVIMYKRNCFSLALQVMFVCDVEEIDIKNEYG
jgi:hypothetical protein